jgi:hypothetical protein
MRFQILRAVDGARLADVVAPPLRRRLPGALLRGGPYTLVLFPLGVDPVRSGAAAKAVARLGPAGADAEPVVALGAGFTAEAHAALTARGATVIAVGEHHWTDASFERIRTSVASPRKDPPPRTR